ncbi:MAG TPA: redox-sensing transcriptional repressor Rex [Mycobacteriales bacterium]|nr:redox-sensing transcriptional repressor Rex [Mycobacteriales bacterium]
MTARPSDDVSAAGDPLDVPSTGLGAARSAHVPDATVARLPVYLRALLQLADAKVATVSSEDLALASGVNSAKVRKDLSQLGSYGTRGVGYDVNNLLHEISRELGLTQPRAVAIVGIGNLGHALAGYGGFAPRGVRIAALLDADAHRIGETVNGLVVQPVSALEEVVAGCDITIGVIATPALAAQQICDRFVGAGVRSILNFAPVTLTVPDDVDVRKVDLSVELQILSFHDQQRSRGRRASAVLAVDPSVDGSGPDLPVELTS